MEAFSRALAAGCLAAGLSSVASPVWAQIFNPESFTLKNGMQVVVIQNHRMPVVSHMVYYKVGSADEVAGKSGLAHMVEHMMFKGTKTVPPGEFSRIVAANGGRDNAFTAADYTAFFQNVAVGKLELVMKLESDRMANLTLKDKDFQPERQVVLEERRMRIENEPSAMLDEQVEAALYLNSPYHHPVIGWRNEIEKYTLRDVVEFHRRWYAPNNAILVVAGDMTAAKLRPLAEKYYGSIPSRPVPARQRTEEPAPIAARTVELRDPDVHQPAWTSALSGPQLSCRRGQVRLSVASPGRDFGGGATSRLNRTLVVEQKVAASAGAGYDPEGVGLTSFSFSASPRPGVPMEKLQEAIVAQIRTVGTSGVTKEEVDQAKLRLQTAVAYAKDLYSAGARVLGAALCTGDSVEDEEAWPKRIAEVTPELVSEAARQVLKDERSTRTERGTT